MQYRDYVVKLEELAPSLSNLNNTEIFSLLLHPDLCHYKNIQSVVGIMANAGVKLVVFVLVNCIINS